MSSKADKIPPQAVRIKRKRTEDPLKGLFLNPAHPKRTRTDSFVFKLAGTFDQEPAYGANILLSEDSTVSQTGEKRKRVFHFPKSKKSKQTEHTPEEPVSEKPASPDEPIPDQINDMVKSYFEGTGPADPYTEDHDVEDYVYDIYYREPYNSMKWEGALSNVGVILFDSDDELFFDDDEDDDSLVGSDDDDSNAEDFYRNDYPDDEDAHSLLDEDSGALREGLEYLGIDDDVQGRHDADETADGEWSEDENFEQYRDRIMGDLENRISEQQSGQD